MPNINEEKKVDVIKELEYALALIKSMKILINMQIEGEICCEQNDTFLSVNSITDLIYEKVSDCFCEINNNLV